MSILRDSMRNPFAGVVFKPVEQSGNVGVIVVPGSDGGIQVMELINQVSRDGYYPSNDLL